MTLKLNGTNSVAAPAYAGDDADTGLQCGTNELKLVTGGTARATVDSNGVVDVAHAYMQVGSGTDGFVQYKSSAGNWHAGAHANNALVFYSGSYGAGSERMRILSSGGLTFNGDTAQANALDDYEEGQHSVTTNANLTLNSGHTNWQYTKVGRLVTFSGFFVITSVSGTNNVEISLPFACASAPTNGNSSAVGPVMALNVDTGNAGLVSFIPQGNSVLKFYQINDGGAWAQLTNDDLVASTEMYITITYLTDA